MRYKVFVDGQAGTTGLQIHERLARRSDLELLRIEEEKRKDPETRRALLNEADVVFLCLPDAASREAVSLLDSDRTRVIDGSTAHRVDPDWTYGLPELNGAQSEKIARAKRVSVPGCHATGFVLAIYPLIAAGIVPVDYPVVCQSVTGYSGGGKALIAKYQAPGRAESLSASRHYALGLRHKHLPEMQRVTGLAFPPLFTPVVGDFYQGMVVAVPLFARLLAKKTSPSGIREVLAAYYAGRPFVTVMPTNAEDRLDEGLYLDPMGCNGTNRAELFVFGHDEQILVLARLDNLGKGASGAAVQCMNIMLGLDERTGLE